MDTKSFAGDARWQLVERVADSALFQKPSRLRDLFLYICEHSLRGEHEALREQRIGEVVFGRGADFRPNEDTIVRVEVRKLRKRLEDYFAGEGHDETLTVSIPKGAYVACFTEHSVVVETPEPEPAPARREIPLRWAIALSSVTLLLGAALSWPLLTHLTGSTDGVNETQTQDPLSAALFHRDQQTFVVCADSGFALFQDVTGASVNLADYVSRNYAGAQGSTAPAMEPFLRLLPSRQYTNISDVRLVQQLLQLNRDIPGHTMVRHARNMQLIDFKNGNFILIGSRRSNPWVELFEKSLNFQFVYDPHTTRPGFTNQSPRPGEKPTYWLEGQPGQATSTYGVVALVPNVDHTGNVLIIEGASGEGTEAAAEYVTHPAWTVQMLNGIGAVERGKVRYFEVLLKSGTLGGTSGRAEIVASRLISPEK